MKRFEKVKTKFSIEMVEIESIKETRYDNGEDEDEDDDDEDEKEKKKMKRNCLAAG